MSGDRVELRCLRVLAHCGVLPHERDQRQPLEIDLDLVGDLGPAGGSDELTDTVDYGAVCDLVELTAQEKPAALLEHLASRVADAVLSLDTRIDGVLVVVRKLRPPVPQDLATAGVRIERWRS